MWLRVAVLALVAVTGLSRSSPGQAVPDSIAADGVPELSADLVRSLARYQHTRSAQFEGWFADRREILISTRFAETNQIHHVALPGAVRTQQTFLDDRVVGASPRPGRAQFLFSADQGGAEQYQLFLDAPATKQGVRFTDGRSRNVSPVWSNTGALLAWSSNSRNGKDMDLYVGDPSEPRSIHRFKNVSGDWSVAAWSPDDRRVALIEWISINETYVHIADVDTGRAEAITPRPVPGAPRVAYQHVRWSKDGRALYWTTDAGSEFRRLARFDLTSRTPATLSAGIPWNVEAFDLSDDGRTVVLVANEDGISRIHVLDALNGQEEAVAGLPAGQISGLQFRKGTREFAFSLSSARATADVFSYDLASGSLVRWTRSEVGGFNPESLPDAELIHYPSFDGRSIPAFVYKAAGFTTPRPVLIDIHGGPESQFRPIFMGRQNYLLQELGIVLIHPNVRGSAGYGKTYLELDDGRLREDSVKDIGALLDWIAKQPGLDASRVGVIGGSYGGYMSLATLTHYGDRIRAGVDIVGISNFVSFLEHTQSYRRDLRRAEYGDERDPAMRQFLETISPLTNASRIRTPLLVAQGKNDPRVPASESEQIVDRVRKNGSPVWYVVGKDEGHGFAKKKNQDYLQSVIALFLQRYLLADSDGRTR